MKEKILYTVWAGLYILCVVLGTVRDVSGFGKWVMILTALLFFVPGGMLVYEGIKQQNKDMLLRLRLVCIGSLSLTMLFIVVNFLSVGASAAAGTVLYYCLMLVSAPMFCAQYWVLSLFLWAFLLFSSFLKAEKTN